MITGIWQRIRGRRGRVLTCAELVELVTDYLEDGLPAVERTRFERHLGRCEGCTNHLEQIRTTIALAGRVTLDGLSEDAQGELLVAFRGWAESGSAR